MKNWADHCSSDEESIDEIADQVEAQKLDEEPAVEAPVAATDAPANETLPTADAVSAGPPAPRTYDFPENPPFTAFIGNLAYALKEPEELKTEVIKVAKDTLGKDINILGARISFDRNGKARGFGYLELETLDELKQLMELNGTQATIAGRKIQLDTANGKHNSRKNQHRRNHGDVDGSKFRDGRFNRARNNEKESGPPLQRTSLKLAPRTKKENSGNGTQERSGGIFGGAKARDAQAWEEKKKTGKSNGNNDGRKFQENKGRAGRGGKGDNTRDGRRASRQSQQKQISPEERAAKAAAAAATAKANETPAPPAKPTAPVNKFALLMDSDSD